MKVLSNVDISRRVVRAKTALMPYSWLHKDHFGVRIRDFDIHFQNIWMERESVSCSGHWVSHNNNKTTTPSWDHGRESLIKTNSNWRLTATSDFSVP